MPSFALKVTRLGFSSFGRLVPSLAGRVAFSLFCRTPSRRPVGAKGKQAFAEGLAQLRHAERLMLPTRHGEVAAYRLPAPEGVPRVLLVHGWGSRAEYLAPLALGLAKAGCEVILLDMPGHGRSFGRRLDMRLAAEAMAAVQKAAGPFDAAVGHSFGGASLMTAAGGIFPGVEPLQAARIGLIGSPSEILQVFADFAREVRLPSAVLARLSRHAETVTGARLVDFDAVEIARRLRRPLLVVHAEDDKEVAAYHARRYGVLVDGVEFLWANGYGHRRIVGAPEVIETVARFVREAGGENAQAGVRLSSSC